MARVLLAPAGHEHDLAPIRAESRDAAADWTAALEEARTAPPPERLPRADRPVEGVEGVDEGPLGEVQVERQREEPPIAVREDATAEVGEDA